MNQPPNQPPVPPAAIVEPPHVCVMGSLSCSGSIPCQGCEQIVREYVLPHAMMMAGFAGSPQQAEAFFQGLNRGYSALHTLMTQDPQFRQRLKMTDFNGAKAHLWQGSVDEYARRVTADERIVVNQTLNGAQPEVVAAVPVVPIEQFNDLIPSGSAVGRKVTSEELDGLLNVQERSNSKQKARVMTTEMDAEDIAQARGGGGVVLGDVMNRQGDK